MWSWLNPLNWIQIFTLIKDLAGIIGSAYTFIMDKIQKWKQEKASKELADAIHEIDKANEIKNDEERLKAKADAAKNIEDKLNN